MAGDRFPPRGVNAEAAVGPSCAFCEKRRAAWMHQLDTQQARFRIYGKGHTWADRAGVCSRCEQLYRTGDDKGLNAVRDRTWPEGEVGAQEYLDNSLAAFRRSDLGAIPVVAVGGRRTASRGLRAG